MLIDSICELIKDNELLSKKINVIKVEKVDLTEQMPKLQENCRYLSFENDFLNEKVIEIPKYHKKVKGEGRRI